jgi:hypothetical protein
VEVSSHTPEVKEKNLPKWSKGLQGLSRNTMISISIFDWTSFVLMTIVIWCNATMYCKAGLPSGVEHWPSADSTGPAPRDFAWIVGRAETRQGLGRSSAAETDASIVDGPQAMVDRQL